jgi:hypothetical protein
MRRPLLVILLISVALAFGLADVRQRARLDRGLRSHRTDFTVYQAAAQALREGTDPYEARSPRGYRYVYPPLLAVLLLPVADWEAPNAALLFYAASLLALVLAIACIARVVPGGNGTRTALVGALACAVFLTQSFERGQVTILLMALQAGALLALTRGRTRSAGLLLGIGGALRLTPFLAGAAALVGFAAARRWRDAGDLALGLGLAVALGFAVIPALALGPKRALDVDRQWLATSSEVFGGSPGELAELDNVNEYRFKNQSPRRVLATGCGWWSGASFDDERPALDSAAWQRIDTASYALSAALGVAALAFAAVALRDPRAPGYAPALAALFLLPVAMTRYAWPTHYVAALPAAALALRLAPRALLAFATLTALFYAAHWRPLEPLGAAGPLLCGGVVLMAGLARAALTRRTAETR